MLRNPGWDRIDAVARNQLQLYRAAGEQLGLNDAECRRPLLLNEAEWTAWSEFMADGALPAEPPLPVMLQRLGRATWRLTRRAERGSRAD